MESNKQITYKSIKGNVEITGNSKDVINIIKEDQKQKRKLQRFKMFMIVLVVLILLIKSPDLSWLPILANWLKNRIPLFVCLLVQGNFIRLLLSG